MKPKNLRFFLLFRTSSSMTDESVEQTSSSWQTPPFPLDGAPVLGCSLIVWGRLVNDGNGTAVLASGDTTCRGGRSSDVSEYDALDLVGTGGSIATACTSCDCDRVMFPDTKFEMFGLRMGIPLEACALELCFDVRLVVLLLLVARIVAFDAGESLVLLAIDGGSACA